MECPICAWSPEKNNYLFIWESGLWRVVLAPNQSLLGRCVVHLKRHAGDLAHLARADVLEWLEIVKRLEAALQSAFGAKMFNWACYMNHAYRETTPNPHIHWWVAPRYDRVVTLKGWTFEDPHFGYPYPHERWVDVPPEVHHAIAEGIKAGMID